jgi:hypothetical protein
MRAARLQDLDPRWRIVGYFVPPLGLVVVNNEMLALSAADVAACPNNVSLFHKREFGRTGPFWKTIGS